jgi:hypothetical protein
MRRTKLISNQLGLRVVYIPSCFPSRRRIKLPFELQQKEIDIKIPLLVTSRSQDGNRNVYSLAVTGHLSLRSYA